MCNASFPFLLVETEPKSDSLIAIVTTTVYIQQVQKLINTKLACTNESTQTKSTKPTASKW